MANLSPELVSKFSNLQSNIWQNVSLAVSEAAGVGINFSDAMTLSSEISDLYSEMSSPKLIIQFAFANNPDSNQVVLVSQDTLVDIFNNVTGKSVDSVDENTIAEIRDAVEAIVQGLCLAAGNIRNEAMVASGLSVRLQIFSVPNNMQSDGQVVRTNVRISGEDLSGSLIWLVDEETANVFVNTDQTVSSRPGLSVENGGSAKATGSSGSLSGLEDSGLDMLYDIPLEVSVELGRVRMVVKDVIELGSGSIVEIDKAAGEPVDVMVNGRLVAHGEVVVIEDNFGVRITEILSTADRIAKLNEVA